MRETAFVEIGPVSAFHATTFSALLPFPPLRAGWGLDAHWAAIAQAHEWPIGIVDATPIRHQARRDRRLLRSRGGDRRGTPLPRRAPVRHRRARRSARSPRTATGDEGRDRRRVLPAGRGPGPGRLGAPPGGGRARRGRRRARARPAPPAAVAGRRCAGATCARAARRAAPAARATRSTGSASSYVRYLSPRRGRGATRRGAPGRPRRCAGRWHGCARRFPFELVHAHYAVPAGDALRRAASRVPLLVSVHGGDVHGRPAPRAAERCARTLGHARLVLANSAGTARRCIERGRRAHPRRAPGHRPARRRPADPPATPTLVTVGNLIARKRHADVIEAIALLRDRWPALRYVIVGDGPERAALTRWPRARGVADRVELRGRLPHAEAAAVARQASLFVLPSVAEAFGVSYVEAMAAGVPAVGSRGEDGPEEIAAAGGGWAGDAGRPAGARRGARRAAGRSADGCWRCGRRPGHRGAAVHLGALRRRDRRRLRGGAAWLRPPPASAPYDADNLLDRRSRRATLELNYAHMMERERALLDQNLGLRRRRGPVGGLRLAPGAPPVPGARVSPVGADADPAKVQGVLETGRADEGVVGYAGRLGLEPRRVRRRALPAGAPSPGVPGAARAVLCRGRARCCGPGAR